MVENRTRNELCKKEKKNKPKFKLFIKYPFFIFIGFSKLINNCKHNKKQIDNPESKIIILFVDWYFGDLAL